MSNTEACFLQDSTKITLYILVLRRYIHRVAPVIIIWKKRYLKSAFSFYTPE